MDSVVRYRFRRNDGGASYCIQLVKYAFINKPLKCKALSQTRRAMPTCTPCTRGVAQQRMTTRFAFLKLTGMWLALRLSIRVNRLRIQSSNRHIVFHQIFLSHRLHLFRSNRF